ncbi:DoxX family protein [Streptomyces monticola]|uniref:DoxX family protein n=1 Tax=Streptomyces monticola TaxID=2666263 RepID=A0ABW2JBS9_9ACTN
MFIAYVAVTVVTIAANAAEAVANFARMKAVVANAEKVGFPESGLPLLGTLKGAAAAGLLLGLLGVPYVGVAAAVGLVLFFVCALAAHVRAQVYGNIAGPLLFFALAVATLVLTLAR